MPYATKNKAVQKAIDKGQIEWHMWANTLAVFGSSVMVLGGAVGLAGDLGQQWINIYSLAVGLLLFMMEWARGARKQGRTMARMYQEKITPFLAKFGLLWSNLFVRGILHLGISGVLYIQLNTIIAGIVEALAGLIYIKAGFKGEVWKPLIARERRDVKGQIIKAPTAAPPRRPVSMLDGGASLIVNEAPMALSLKPRRVSNPSFAAPPKPTVRRPPTSAVPSRPAPAPRAAPPKPSVWEAVKDEGSGDTYYYNSQTEVTTWDKPADF